MLERRRQAWAYRGLKPETDRENLKGGRPQIWGSVLHGPQWSWRVSSTCEFSGDAISYSRVPQASTDLSWDHLREPQYSKYSNNVINVVSFDSYTGLQDNGKHYHCATDMKLNFHHSTELRKKPQWSKALGSRSVWYHYPVLSKHLFPEWIFTLCAAKASGTIYKLTSVLKGLFWTFCLSTKVQSLVRGLVQ